MLAIVLLAFSLTFSTVSMANDEGKGKHTAELKVIGKVENHPVFQLDLNNAEEDEFTVTFRDEVGNVLFTDKFEGVNISKKFLLKTEDFGDASLNVVVKAKKTGISEVYTINRSTSYVEETVVNKIK
jgi:DNA-directed RNA polymerase alpha subunit